MASLVLCFASEVNTAQPAPDAEQTGSPTRTTWRRWHTWLNQQSRCHHSASPCAACELQDSATLRPEAARLLRQVCGACGSAVVLAHVESDVGEATLRGALEAAGLLGSGRDQLRPHRCTPGRVPAFEPWPVGSCLILLIAGSCYMHLEAEALVCWTAGYCSAARPMERPLLCGSSAQTCM